MNQDDMSQEFAMQHKSVNVEFICNQLFRTLCTILFFHQILSSSVIHTFKHILWNKRTADDLDFYHILIETEQKLKNIR